MGHTLSRLLRPCKCLLKTQARSEPRTETTLPGQSEQAELASKLHRVHCYTGHTASLRRSTPTAHRRAPSAGAAFRREAAPAANTPFWRSRVSRRRSCCLCGSPAGSCPTWRYSTSQPCADSRRAAARGPPSSSPDRAVSCGPTTWPHAGAGRSVHSSVTMRSATLSAPACRRLQCAWAAPGEPQGGRLRAGSLCPRSRSCPRPAAAPRTAPPAPSPAQAGTPGLKHALRRRASRSPTRGDPGQRPWAQGDALESLVFMRGRIMHAHQPGHACRLSDGTVTAALLHHLAALRASSGGSASAPTVPAACACCTAWCSWRCRRGSSVRRACAPVSAASRARNCGISVRPSSARPLRAGAQALMATGSSCNNSARSSAPACQHTGVRPTSPVSHTGCTPEHVALLCGAEGAQRVAARQRRIRRRLQLHAHGRRRPHQHRPVAALHARRHGRVAHARLQRRQQPPRAVPELDKRPQQVAELLRSGGGLPSQPLRARSDGRMSASDG